jgi:molybdopterin converting factor small subunit
MAKVLIPLFLTEMTGGVRQVEVPGATLAEIVAGLESLYPGIGEKIGIVEGGRATAIFVVDNRLTPKGLATQVDNDSQVSLLPAFGGG